MRKSNHIASQATLVLIRSCVLLIYPLVHKSWKWLRQGSSETNGKTDKWEMDGIRKKGKKSSERDGEEKKNELKILPCHLLEWYCFKPVKKWNHSPNQPLRQREKLATSGLLTPEMYQPLSVLPYTIHFLLARVPRCGHHETELGQPVRRALVSNSLRPSQVDQWAEEMEKSERDRWPGKSWLLANPPDLFDQIKKKEAPKQILSTLMPQPSSVKSPSVLF